MENKRVLEALQMQPLSEEEKAARHILGRLYGPIATCKESTRNGRLYNKQLWENALRDDLLKEKIATKGLFLELGHPTDREETDMTKVCACIPELPKIVDDDLYAYVDILDTPNGKLLKTLVDYGFVPGISSRGSGDLMANNEVDPETFFLETWDIVQLPAVKKARLSVCESVNSKNIKLKKALTESLDTASVEDREIMEDALKNLKMKNLKEDEYLPGGTPTDIDKIPMASEDAGDNKVLLVEENDETDVDETVVDTEEPEDAVEDDIDTGEAEPEAEEEEEEVISDEDCLVGNVIEALQDVGKDEKIGFTIEGTENGFEIWLIAGDDNKIVATTFSKEEVEDEIKNCTDSEDSEEPEEAEDAGDEDKVLESLKEAVRRKNELERRVNALTKAKAVSDAKVDELNESVKRYKFAFERTSELASKTNNLKTKVKTLTEQLQTKTAECEQLTAKANNAATAAKNAEAQKKQVTTLTEQLNSVSAEADSTKEDLAATRKKLQERTEIAKKYQKKFFEAVNKYIDSKAKMLGVSPDDIRSKLREGFSMDDIDEVCNKLLDSSVSISRLPFGSTGRVHINESRASAVTTNKQKTADPDAGYEIDDDLLILAGLK